MTKSLFLFILFVLRLTTHSQAQNKKNLDSLNVAYQNAKHDTTKIMALLDIAYEYRNSKPDTCIALATQALEKSEKIGFEKGRGIALNSKGLGYITKSQYTEALVVLQTALVVIEKIKDSKKLKATILNNTGNIYFNQGNYPLALEYWQKSLRIREEIGDKQGIGSSLSNIGVIYLNQGDAPLALEYYQKSLKIQSGIGYKQGVGIILTNIGNIYRNQGNYSLALEYYQKSLKIREEIGDKQGISYILNNIADIYNNQGQITEAIRYYQQSLEIKRALKDRWATTYTLNGLAQVYQQQKNYDKAIEYAQEGLKIAQEIKALAEVKLLSTNLYQTYKLKEEYDKALSYYELAKQVNDSLFTVEKAKAITNLESKMNLEKKEKELILLTKDNDLNKLNAEKKEVELAITKKQAEAEYLLSLARAEKDKRKQDSLFNLVQKVKLEAQKALLETENLKVRERGLEAENKAKQLEIAKIKEAELLQQKMNYLIVFVSIIITLFLWYFYQNWQKEKKAKEIIALQKGEIQAINENLASLVKKRTITLEERNKQLEDYAFFNAHKLRKPVSTILGLYLVLQMEDDAKEKELVFEYLNQAVLELDEVVREIQEIVAKKE